MSILSYLDNLATSLNLNHMVSQEESLSIHRSLQTIIERSARYFSSSIYPVKSHITFGSIKRDTLLPRWADYKSDVDLMVVFENPNFYKPASFYRQLKLFAEYHYSTSISARQSAPAVVLELSHIFFDLVPAYYAHGRYYVGSPSSSYSNWIETEPYTFTHDFKTKNSNENYKIKPLCRLLKYWNAQNGRIYNSFELEQQIARMSFSYCSNLSDYFFSAVEQLNEYEFYYTQYKLEKIRTFKQRIREVKQYQFIDSYTAENTLKRAFS